MNTNDLEHEIPHKRRDVNDLIRFIKNRIGNNPNYALFLGAGCSVSSGIKSAQDLIEEWRKDLFHSFTENKNKEYSKETAIDFFMKNNHSNWYNKNSEYSSLFEKKYDLPRQRRIFVEEQVSEKKPSLGYAYLVKLINENFLNTIFTTNFDDLLNEAFHLFSEINQKRPIVCAHDSSVKSITITSNRPKIIKLHGDYLYDDIKSTLRETETLQENIKNKLIEFSKEFGLIIVGYAGNDRSVMDVINYLLKSDDYFKNGIYWCLRRNDEISDELKSLLWKDRVYYTYIDGFDELFTEMYHAIINPDSLPLPSLFSLGIKGIMESFIENDYLKKSKSSLLQKTIDKIKMEYKKNHIFDILKDIIDIKSDNLLGESFDDKEMIAIMEIDQLAKEKKYHEAIARIQEIIVQPNINKKFCNRLKEHLIGLYAKTEKTENSKLICDEFIRDNPNRRSFYFRKANLTYSIDNKIKILEDALIYCPYDYKIYNELAEHYITIYGNCIINKEAALNKAIIFCKKSILHNPSCSNVGRNIFLNTLLTDKGQYYPNWEQEFLVELEEIKKQNKDTPEIYRFEAKYIEATIKQENTKKEKLLQIYNSVSELADKYYNEDKIPYYFIKMFIIDHYRFSSKYHEAHNMLKAKDLQNNTSFLFHYAMFLLSREGKLSDAISVLERISDDEKDYDIIKTLINFYCYKKDFNTAQILYNKYCSEFSERKKLLIQSTLLAAQSKYEDEEVVIDKLEIFSKYQHEFLTLKVYCLMKQGKFDLAYNITKEYLQAPDINFSPAANEKIINHELSKIKTFQDKKPNKERLEKLKEYTQENLTKAACCALLNQTEGAINYIKEGIREDFSRYFDIIDWPVFETLHGIKNFKILIEETEKKIN